VIGHFLLTLTPEQEDEILTTAMLPNIWTGPCLVATVCRANEPRGLQEWRQSGHDGYMHVAVRYDKLCRRFGTPRINNAIRARILGNRLWRELSKSAALAYTQKEPNA